MFRKWQHIRWQASQNEHNHSSLCVPVPISFRSHLPISVQKQCAVSLPKYSLSCVNSHLAALQKVVSFYHHSNFREVSKPESMDIQNSDISLLGVPSWEIQHLHMKVAGEKKYLLNSSAPELAMSQKCLRRCSNIIPVEKLSTHESLDLGWP